MKKAITPEFYNDNFLIGIIKHKNPLKWTYIVSDDSYLDSYYFQDVFGDRKELEPLMIGLLQANANLHNRKVRLSKFLQSTLSEETLHSQPIIKGKYIMPGEINDSNIKITIRVITKHDNEFFIEK